MKSQLILVVVTITLICGSALGANVAGQSAAQAQALTNEQKTACGLSCDSVGEKDMCMRNRRPSGCTSCKHTASSAKKGTAAGEAWGPTWRIVCP